MPRLRQDLKSCGHPTLVEIQGKALNDTISYLVSNAASSQHIFVKMSHVHAPRQIYSPASGVTRS
jgi:hypothetical protein